MLRAKLLLIFFVVPIIEASPRMVNYPLLKVPTDLILEGKKALSGDFLYAVSLQVQDDHFCGGSIIHKKWVLTAAHCTEVCEINKCIVEYGTNKLKFGIKIGVKDIIQHPDFKLVHKKNSNEIIEVQNDLSLIELESSITFDSSVQPVRLSSKAVGVGAPGIISGWGLISDEETTEFLQMATMSTYNCPNFVRRFKHFLCLRSSHSAAFSGDSGGPLEISGQLVGVCSFGAGKDLNVYTDVYKYEPWILNTIQLKGDESEDEGAFVSRQSEGGVVININQTVSLNVNINVTLSN